MSSIHTKFIHGFDDKISQFLVPSIDEGQVITAYIGEDITPYVILGENFSTIQGQIQLLSQKINDLKLSS